MIKIEDHIKSLIPYIPGKPIEELERELQLTNIVKLASNENSLGPSPFALKAISKDVSNINRYPDGGGFYLKNELSRFHDINPENIILGNGSNELIEIAARSFMSYGDEALMADQSFIIFGSVTQAVGGCKKTIPLNNFSYDLERMADNITKKTKIVFIANPDNPTGTSVGRKSFNEFLNKIPDNLIVIIDEAYIGYQENEDFPDSCEYLKSGKNVLILRTFSKIYGLAGLRIGYAMGKKEHIETMNKLRQPFNTNSLAQVAAIAALSDTGHIKASQKNNNSGKKYLYKEFTGMGISFVPTDTNFILLDVGDGIKVYEHLLRKGVIVRPMNGYRFPSHIRVTIGTLEENKKFIYELGKLRMEK